MSFARAARNAARPASQHQLRVLHPAVLIARAPRHHQQVRRFRQRQRLALKLAPFRLGFGLSRGDVEEASDDG